MTNTIPNVPRELLERIIQFRWIADDLEVKDCRKKLRALLSAPSPAGVDGLEVGDVECNCSWNPDSHDKTCPVYLRDRLSDAQAIIDGLRGEVARYRAVLDGAKYPNLDKLLSFSVEDCRFLGETVASMTISVQSERDQHAQRIGELEGLLRHAQKQVPTGSGLHMRIDAALSAVCAAAPNIATTSEHSSQPERDPCPMCIKGGICNTPTCGRLLAMPKAY